MLNRVAGTCSVGEVGDGVRSPLALCCTGAACSVSCVRDVRRRSGVSAPARQAVSATTGRCKEHIIALNTYLRQNQLRRRMAM